MPKHTNRPTKLLLPSDLRRKVDMQYQVSSTTEFLLKKVSKLEGQLEQAEIEISKLKSKLKKNVKKYGKT